MKLASNLKFSGKFLRILNLLEDVSHLCLALHFPNHYLEYSQGLAFYEIIINRGGNKNSLRITMFDASGQFLLLIELGSNSFFQSAKIHATVHSLCGKSFTKNMGNIKG